MEFTGLIPQFLWPSQKIIFYVDAIKLAAYAEQLLPASKATVCCILPRGIVWTHF